MVGLLQAEPREAVRSLEELFALAQELESRAAARYGGLANNMREQGAVALAAILDDLAAQRRRRQDRVIAWSNQWSGKAQSPKPLRWELPEMFDDESIDQAAASLVTPYRILAMAVRNEQRAFSLFSYIAANTTEPAVREVAEAMARDKLERVSALRRERRRAFHAERDRGAPTRKRASPQSFGEIAELEDELADQLDLLGEQLKDESSRLRAREFARQSRELARELCRATAGTTERTHIHEDGASRPIEATAELLVERYLALAEDAEDEAAVRLAQAHAQTAIARLAWVRRVKDGERTERVSHG